MYYFITLLMLLLLIGFIVTALSAVFPVKIFAAANSEQLPELRMVFTWLKPLFRGTVEKNDDGVLLKIYLFNKGILTQNIRSQGTSIGEIFNTLREAHLRSIKINASYGFEDPSITGMFFGAVNLVSEYLDIDVEYNRPDFNLWDDYFSIKATAEANPLSLMLSYFKSGKKHTKMNPLYGGR